MSSTTENIAKIQAELETLELEKSKKLKCLANYAQDLPQDDSLLFFYGEGCPYTKRSEPAILCLEASLGKKIKRLETWKNDENSILYRLVGGYELCGGVPFFYNENTKNSLCGAQNCEDLKKWAQS